ncbi:5476_t:CDS:2, partial [Dentiscutata heterogama]
FDDSIMIFVYDYFDKKIEQKDNDEKNMECMYLELFRLNLILLQRNYYSEPEKCSFIGLVAQSFVPTFS